MFDLNFFSIVGYLFVILGLAGAVVPIVPGPFLIWLGALIWAWSNDFREIGPLLLVVLGLMALLAWGMDLLVNWTLVRKTGASWRAFAGAILGGFGGGLLLSGTIPILGTLFGAFVGALAGTWIAEWYAKRDAAAATRAARTYVGSFILSSLLEIVLSVAMVSLFLWRALL